jgi:hypothetical protein
VTEEQQRVLFEETLARLFFLQEEARAGRFTVGDQPDPRTSANIDAQVQRFQVVIDDIELALAHLDRSKTNGG